MCYSCYMRVIFSAMGFQIEFIFRGDLQRLSQGGCHAQYLGNSVILNFPMCSSLKIDFHLKSIRASLALLSVLSAWLHSDLIKERLGCFSILLLSIALGEEGII